MRERGFRDQLVIPGQRELFDYWTAVSGADPIPTRAAIDPRRIPRLLPNICLIDVKAGLAESCFRLAGTALRNIYGSELTGQPVETVVAGRTADYWRRIHGAVIDRGVGQSGVVRGPVNERDHVVMYWLRLPLVIEGPTVRFILGYDFAAPVPSEGDGLSPDLPDPQQQLPLCSQTA